MIEREKYMQARVVNYHGVNSIEINGKIFQYVGYRSWTPKEKYLRAFDDLGFPFMTMLPSGIKNTLDFYRYTNSIVLDTLQYFARLVKEHTQNRLIVGAPAGYIMNTPQADAGNHLPLQGQNAGLLHRSGIRKRWHAPADRIPGKRMQDVYLRRLRENFIRMIFHPDFLLPEKGKMKKTENNCINAVTNGLSLHLYQ